LPFLVGREKQLQQTDGLVIYQNRNQKKGQGADIRFDPISASLATLGSIQVARRDSKDSSSRRVWLAGPVLV